MKIETRITLIRTEQPAEEVWTRLQQFARDWNRSHAHPFTESMGIFLDLTFEDSSYPEYLEISEALKKLQADLRIQVHIVRQRIYDEDDYATADFVEINGAALDETPGNQLTLNARDVLTPQPCPRCGYGDVFSQVQTGPFAINETELDHLGADGAPPPREGWDFLEVEGGHKLVSTRFSALLSEHSVQGYTLEPVLAGRDGAASKRISQLRARRAIVSPCPEHTRAIDGYFCPECGAAHCEVEDEDWVRSDWIGQDEVFARHRHRGAIFYVSGRVYRLLVEAGLQQIKPGRIFRICHHD
jgi:hypothetical protein